VKLDACGLEWQAAEVQDAAHAALQILDDILVLHAQDAAWQGCVPMTHQIQVGAVVARDILDA